VLVLLQAAAAHTTPVCCDHERQPQLLVLYVQALVPDARVLPVAGLMDAGWVCQLWAGVAHSTTRRELDHRASARLGRGVCLLCGGQQERGTEERESGHTHHRIPHTSGPNHTKLLLHQITTCYFCAAVVPVHIWHIQQPIHIP
jgi:hypothetical protein